MSTIDAIVVALNALNATLQATNEHLVELGDIHRVGNNHLKNIADLLVEQQGTISIAAKRVAESMNEGSTDMGGVEKSLDDIVEKLDALVANSAGAPTKRSRHT